MPTELEIEEGQIYVNSVTQVIDYDDVKVWELDLRSKYPSVFTMGDYSLPDEPVRSERHSAMLCADERTLYYNEATNKPTLVTFVAPPGERWTAIHDWGKYTVRFVAYRYPENYYETSPTEEVETK